MSTLCIDHGKRGNSKGYATISHRNKTVIQHRLVYTKHHNLPYEAITGKVIRHTCDNSRCINPEHLLIGTALDNVRDRQERNRQSKGEEHPASKLTEDAVMYIVKHYQRGCKTFGSAGLAKKFNVSSRTVLAASRGETWGHLTGVKFND